jgi:maltose O-acetyltransferase
VSALERRGAKVELPAFISRSVWEGKPTNLEIGKGTFVGRAEVQLHDRVSIGRKVVINDGVLLLTGSHDVNDPDFRLVTRPIIIHDYVWIATKATILPGVTIGQGAVVGAGAVVSIDIPPYAIVVGNPATRLNKSRTPNLRYEPLRNIASIEAWLRKPEIAEQATSLQWIS